MQDLHLVTEDQATWLRILERREYERLSDDIAVPDHVLEALVQKRLVRRWSDGAIAITLGGIREVAQHLRFFPTGVPGFRCASSGLPFSTDHVTGVARMQRSGIRVHSPKAPSTDGSAAQSAGRIPRRTYRWNVYQRQSTTRSTRRCFTGLMCM